MSANTNNIDLVPQEALDELKKLDSQLRTTKKNLESLLGPVAAIGEELAKSATSYKKLTDLVNKLDKAEKQAIVTFKEQDKAMSDVRKLQEKLITLSSNEAKETAKLKEQIRQKTKENRDSAKAMMEEAAAAEKLADKLRSIPDEKTVTVTVTTKNTTVSSTDSGAAPQADTLLRTTVQLEEAFNRISESGFTNIVSLLKNNETGMTDYSAAINAASERLAYIEALQNDYKSALEGGAVALEDYNRKIQELNAVQDELQQNFNAVNESFAQNRAEAANASYSSEMAAEAFAELTERAQELTKNLIELRTEQSQVKTTLQELEEAYESGSVSEENYIQQKAELNTLYDNNSDAIKNATRELALEVKAANTAAGSYDNLSARYSLMKIKLNAMTEAGQENTEEFNNLQGQAKELYEQMKELQSATGKESLNVGNYSELPEWLDSIIEQMSQVPGATSTAAGGFSQLSQAARALLANPVMLFIAAIVGTLSLLFDAFKKSETGSRLLEKAGNVLSGIMMAVTKVVDNLSKGLLQLFENPKQALEDFGEKFKQAFMDRIKAAGDFVVALKDAAVALFNLDFDKVNDSLKDAGDSLLKFNTGFSVQDIKNSVGALKEVTESAANYSKALNQLAADALKVKNANEAIQRQVADLSAEEAKCATVAADSSLSQQERLSAEEKAYAAAEKRAKAEYQMAKSNLDMAAKELKLHESAGENVDELKTKYTAAYVGMRQAEQQYIAEKEKSKQRINLINIQSAAEEIDILTETTENQKAVNLRKMKEEATTYDQRKEILAKTSQMIESSLAAEVAIIGGYAKEKIDIDALLAENDQNAVNEKIQQMELSELMEGKLLEVIKDYRKQKQDLNEASITSEKRLADETLKQIARQASATGQEIQTKESGENKDLAKEYASGLMSEEVYQARKKAIADKYTQERFNAEAEAIKQSIGTEGISDEQKMKLTEQLGQKQVDFQKWQEQQEIASAEAVADKKKELLQAVFDFGNQLVEQQFAAKLEGLEKESEENEAWAEEETERIDRLEESGAISKEQADARKALVDDQAQARQEEIEQKKKELQKKQAIYERAMTVAQIGWNTASAVMAAWTNPWAAPAMVPLIIAMGAVQLASVLATPLPEYAKGTSDHPGGLAIVGDGGRSEMIVSNGMLFKTPATDTLVDLPAHAVVYPDFNQALSGFVKLPPMPEKKEDRVISFGELSGLMKANNKQVKTLVTGVTKDRHNRHYQGELKGIHKLIR